MSIMGYFTTPHDHIKVEGVVLEGKMSLKELLSFVPNHTGDRPTLPEAPQAPTRGLLYRAR